MKAELTAQKLRGGYYTPEPIARFLAEWAIQSPAAEVLEPSCGDGNLLIAAAQALLENGANEGDVTEQLLGVEYDVREAKQAEDRLRALDIPVSSETIHIGDFFAFAKEHLYGQRFLGTIISPERRFDAIIGNPPFIRYHNFPEEHRTIAFEFMREAGLHPNRLTNAWLPFLVLSAQLLKDTGRIAMVIPAELFQVNYAAETRQFLSDTFGRITLVTFKKLVFDSIQQEVVLFLGERNGEERHGIRAIELNDIDDLRTYEHTAFVDAELKPMDHSTEKWTQYFLNTEEILLLRSLRADTRLTISGTVIDVDIGVVTGENDFFVLTSEEVEQRGLQPYVRRIVSRSGHLRGTIYSDTDWQSMAGGHTSAYLFTPPASPLEELPPAVQQYILEGQSAGYHEGFKCRIRNPWYVVPTLWVPHAFMLRQVHGYPKIILNEANATCTDTIHRVRFRQGVDGRTVTAAFMNSLTFAFSEVTGRSYGGGVMTFEPSEAERLPLPLNGAHSLNLSALDAQLRSDGVQAVLDNVDRALLTEGLAIDPDTSAMLRGIWEKLRDRRINRK